MVSDIKLSFFSSGHPISISAAYIAQIMSILATMNKPIFSRMAVVLSVVVKWNIAKMGETATFSVIAIGATAGVV